MAATQLTQGAVAAVKSDNTDQTVTVKLTNITKLEKKWSCTITDGSGAQLKAFLLTQVKRQLDAGSLQIREGAVVALKTYTANLVAQEHVLMITDLDVVAQGDGKDPAAAAAAAAAGAAPGTAAAASDAAGAKADQQAAGTPAGKRQAAAAQQQQQQAAATPAAPGGAAAAAGGVLRPLTPGPAPSPSEEVRGTPAATPAAPGRGPLLGATPQPPATGSPIVVGSRAGVQPIAALNPYQKNWCIKAKVVRKGPARSFTGRGSSGAALNRVFNVELADAAGTAIQGTFWREAADRYLDSLEEGKVYYFSNFAVKPANKQYATVRNDYELSFDARTEIEEAADQSGISGAPQVELVPFERLIKHVGRKAPVDVCGVVVSVGQLGTVKRKVDASELHRRDITLADSSKLSVVLTLWAENAMRPELDGCAGAVMQVTRVRVNDYNGCALSAVSRSEVTVNPDTPEAAALRSWWEAEGSTAHLEPLGQAAGGGGGSGGPRPNKLELLEDIKPKGELPPPDAKPTYHEVMVAVTQVMDERVMYLANPENGKKVEPRDGRYWCEADATYCEAAEWRYVLQARVADASDEAYVSVFNQQGVQLMGVTADEAHAAQEADAGAVQRLAKGAQWGEWSMVLSAKTREYNGDRRVRYTVTRMSPVDYAQEGHRLLQLIQQQTARQ